MNVQVSDLMVTTVMTANAHQTCGHIRKLLKDHNVNCLPIVNPEGEPVGIVSSVDFLDDHSEGTRISQFMTKKVYTVPQYSDASLAARIMRNHQIHHLIVTNHKKVVGILSSFDLLKLVENHRFVLKNPPTPSARKGGKRRKEELRQVND